MYAQIKARLLDGDFPFDARLAEISLAKDLDASRTPVREALLRLWSEGHVERHPDGGFRPVLPDAGVIADLYDVRIALETHAWSRYRSLVAVVATSAASRSVSWWCSG